MAFQYFFCCLWREWITPRDLKVEKHFIISKIIQIDTAHSLTVCTNTCVVFTFESVDAPPGEGLALRVTLSGTQRSGFQKHQRDLNRVVFRRRRALCSHCAGFAGLAHRTGVLAPGIFTDK